MDIKAYEEAVINCQGTKLVNGILLRNGLPVPMDRNNYYIDGVKTPIKYVLAYKMRLLKGVDFESCVIQRIDKRKPISAYNIEVKSISREHSFDKYIRLVNQLSEDTKMSIWNSYKETKNKSLVCKEFHYVPSRIVIDICKKEIW